MVSPIRFVGFDAPNVAAPSGHRISYVSGTGAAWLLHSPNAEELSKSPVVLVEDGWGGGEAAAELAEQETVNRFGVRVSGSKQPPFDGELSVVVRDLGAGLDTVWRQWRRSWHYLKPGQLEVTSPSGKKCHTRVVLRGVSDVGSDMALEKMMQEQVQWRGLDGCWLGDGSMFQGAAKVTAEGDLSPRITASWSTGQAGWVKTPDGRTVTLPAFSSDVYAVLDFDRGMMGHVTDGKGNTRSTLWSALRGQVFGVEITPGEETSWEMSPGVTLTVQPRFYSPWRW